MLMIDSIRSIINTSFNMSHYEDPLLVNDIYLLICLCSRYRYMIYIISLKKKAQVRLIQALFLTSSYYGRMKLLMMVIIATLVFLVIVLDRSDSGLIEDMLYTSRCMCMK